MKWDGTQIQYEVFTDTTEWYIAEELNLFNEPFNEPFKEETMEEFNIVRIGFNGDKAKLTLPDGYEFKTEGKEVYVVKKQPQYPKTYKKCCDVLGIGTMDNDAQGYKADLIIQFQKLLIARDAYWKITGEQMGLDKPWKPDWLNVEQAKYVLSTHNNAICSNRYSLGHNILAFPTEEMRDVFYGSFKELIENCKELL